YRFGRLEGKKAWRQGLGLAAISAAKVESSLGPMGAYKMVAYNRGPERIIKVTKDAVEVLSELQVQYPALVTLAEAARMQREDVGDGVTTFVMLLASLLSGAEKLMEKKVHPNVILKGYLKAATEASRVFDEAALPREATDDEVLEMVDNGRDILTPKIRADLKEAAARAEKQGGIDLKRIRVLTKSGGSTADSKLIKGVMVRKPRIHPSMVEEVRNAKVALVNKAFDTKPLELMMPGKGPFSIKLEVTDQGQIQRFKAGEKKMDDDLVAAVTAAGAKVVVCRAKIREPIADQMSRMGILAFEMIDQADMDAVGEATGATAIGEVKNLKTGDLGKATNVRAERIEGVDYFFVEAEKGSTLLLRGSSVADTQELELVVKNAVRLMGSIRKDGKAVWGGGATYMRITTRLREYALEFPGKEQMAILAFADALEQIPGALIRNFGLNYSKVLPEIRSYHARGVSAMGVGPRGVTDMDGENGVRDLVLPNKLLLSRAYEVSRLLLRIDEYIYAKELPLFHKK
ncbi:MAG: TCP-1/cpn60 chaperonin family protein, partial [Thaumarchaeota archaeon]|nr:TCP-1/cpn60 chaperonin family protein [Nitrososphaerota archaeon]